MNGPALRICPECGAVIGRDRLYAGGKLFILPLPRTCPYCDAFLTVREHARHADREQTELLGVA
jgi:predicted RNA-binding Zn-ribbon protein involved in translation (DUF1610 family)